MIDYLWTKGVILVAGRSGLQKLWDLSERVLPDWTPRERLAEREVVYRAAQKSLRALGVARPRHIEQHYIRGRYPNLKRALADLEADGRIERVAIADGKAAWPGLAINAVYAEPGAPADRAVARAVAQAIEGLAGFLGASDIAYDRRRLPAAWKRDLLT
jgi:uncharacterized protein YcaQ